MKHLATISSKGQITLPAEFRRQLKLQEGDKITIVKRGNALELKASSYDQELAVLRARAQACMKANGTWGLSLNAISQRAEAARRKQYEEKYGLSA